ncbi:MAG: MBL fold metallo-hydrolase [Gammaproteobacteria bacterium]
MSMPIAYDYDHAITAIDTGYLRAMHAACYLVIENGRAAVIDTGTWHTVDRVMQVLADKGLAPEDVDYVMPTHVHLDHAGGAGELMRRLPNARLVIHPRGARHMIDPSRLSAATIEVYGDEFFRKEYVELVPVPGERVVEMNDGQVFDLNGRPLELLDTPGHARHHYCVWDARSRGFFTGDTFGVSYRDFDTASGAFMIVPSTPVQFDPEAWNATIERMMGYDPERMFLTHFGEVTEVERLARDLRAGIDRFSQYAQASEGASDPYKVILSAITTDVMDGLDAHGVGLDREARMALLDLDLDLFAEGLKIWMQRKAA